MKISHISAILTFGILILIVGFFINKPRKPNIILSANIIDFGKLPKNSMISKCVQIQNNGNNAVNLSAKKTGCNCVSLELDRHQLNHNETANLSIILDTKTLSRTINNGEIEVLIETDDPGSVIIPILVKYAPAGDAWVNPPILDFGRVNNKDLPVSMNIEIFLNTVLDCQDPTQLKIYSNDPFIKVHPVEHQSDKNRSNYFIEISENTPSGELFSQICAVKGSHTDDPNDKVIYKANIIGNIRGDYYSKPQCGNFSKDGPSELTLSIFSRDKNAFKIIDCVLPDGLSRHFEVHWSKSEKYERNALITIKKIKEENCESFDYLTILCESEVSNNSSLRVPVYITP